MAKKRVLTEEEIDRKKVRELARSTRYLKTNAQVAGDRDKAHDLILYLSNKFDVTYIQEYIFKKLYEINKGTFKGLIKPVPYADQLAIFKYYDKDINTAIARLQSTSADKNSIISYCIAIMLSKSNDYYTQVVRDDYSKERTKEVAQEHKATEKIMQSINRTVEEHNKAEEKLDLSELLDFGYDNDEEEQ